MIRPTHRPKSPDNGPKRRGCDSFYAALHANNPREIRVWCRNPIHPPWDGAPTNNPWSCYFDDALTRNNPWCDESLQLAAELSL